MLSLAAAFLRREVSIQHFLNFGPLHPQIQAHIGNVYTAVCGIFSFFSAGYGLSSFLTNMNMGSFQLLLGLIACCLWYRVTPPWGERRRVIILMIMGFLLGISWTPMMDFLNAILKGETTTFFNGAFDIGPPMDTLRTLDKKVADLVGVSFGGWIHFVIRTCHQGNLLVLWCGSAATFASFAVGASASPRRKTIYAVGAVPILILLIILPTVYYSQVGLVALLAVYVMGYSQEMVVRAQRGSNYSSQSLALIVDMIPYTFSLCCAIPALPIRLLLGY
ncbi:hypothetical protein ACH5RR_022533 [Cinchona calisaya]|uniref:Uncharacterized protein n=1 Tax=Cinchona calisaya TaxID=153742 RepID=A0ABD2Z824_9GENT